MKNNPPDIAILGAGITGLMIAQRLCINGHNIALYDPAGLPADNASWKAGGMLAPYSEIEHMNPSWIEAGLDSIALWQDIQKSLETDFDFHQSGSLLLAHEEDRYILERFRAHLPENAGKPASVSELEPRLAPRFKDGIFLEREAHLHPQRAMTALSAFLESRITIHREAADPQDLKAGTVIDCRGMGAAREDKTLRGVKGELALVHNPEFSLSRPVRLMHPRYPLYIVPRPDNIFMIGATVIESEENEQVSLKSSMELLSALYSLHPGFGEARILSLKAGIRPAYPDNLPRITQNGRIIRCNGLFRHGFLLAPVIAQCVTAMIEGRENRYTSLFTKTHRKDSHDENHNQRAA